MLSIKQIFHEWGVSNSIVLRANKTGIALIRNDTPCDYPKETDLGKNFDNLYIAGGLTDELIV